MKYKFRAETISDALFFCNSCPEGTLSNFESKIDKDFPDVEVSFSCAELDIDFLRRMAGRVDDGHVIVQTLQPLENYTGERNYELK